MPSDDDEYADLTIEQLQELENWMYDMDVESLDNHYYDERMRLIRYIEDRRNGCS